MCLLSSPARNLYYIMGVICPGDITTDHPGDASAFCSRVKCFCTRACRYSKTHYCTFDNCRFIYPLFEVDEPFRLLELT